MERWLTLPLAMLFAGCMDVPSPLAPGESGSIGFPHDGVLTQPKALPQKGVGFTRLRADDANYGIPRLVDLITGSAATVARRMPGGPPLVIGDLSHQHGGGSEGHRSHRTGRDADLLFFVTTPEGVPIKSPGFVKFGADGLAEAPGGKYVRLDLDRNWQLVKALITTPGSDVQWLFASHPITAMLIEHAQALGEDPALIWYAETVIHQPKDSLPHDDHLHLRIACSPDDAVHGCMGGPEWPFLSREKPVALTDQEELKAILE